MSDKPTPESFLIESIVSHRTSRGRVNLTWKGVSTQLSVTEARDLALNLLEASYVAEADAAIVRMVRDHLEADEQSVGAGLLLYRQIREEMEKEEEAEEVTG